MRGLGAGSEVVTDFYTYGVTFGTINSSESVTSSIQIEADSDFEIIKLAAYGLVNVDDDPVTIDQLPLTVMLTDTGSGRNLMNTAVPIQSLFGTGQLPFILPKTKLLYARSVLAITVANISTAVSFSYLALSFHGRKIFSQS